MGAAEAPPALKTAPKFIFFSDFDGTITRQDSNDHMTDTLGFGAALREQGNQDVLFGRRSFRDSFQEMMESVKLPFDECIAVLLKHIQLDEGFKEFYEWTKQENIPLVILSGGMQPIIRALLENFLGKENLGDLQIVSNSVDIREDGQWDIVFHDDSSFGHDKSIEIRKYSALIERPVLFYAGDGVSDLSAAKETDLLFAKAGRDLATYCENERVPFVTFNDFSDILVTMKEIVVGKLTVKEAAKGRIS